MQDQRPNLYTIKGGIGKCVAFTALIDKLVAHDGKKIAVASGFPGVFAFHPKVAGVLKSITPEAIAPVVEKFDDIVMREPYISRYIRGDRHILDEWARLYGMEPFEGGGFNARPDLYVSDAIQTQTAQLAEKIGQKFLIVQWTGGQPPNNFKNKNKYPDNYLTKARNVRNYQEIMLALAEAYPEHLFVVYALPNEPVQMPEQIRPRIRRINAPSLAYAALLKYADGFVALDSSLQHYGAAKQVDKKGVVLWGRKTTPQQIGYSFHTNLSSTADDEVIVPPAKVLDAVKALLKR